MSSAATVVALVSSKTTGAVRAALAPVDRHHVRPILKTNSFEEAIQLLEGTRQFWTPRASAMRKLLAVEGLSHPVLERHPRRLGFSERAAPAERPLRQRVARRLNEMVREESELRDTYLALGRLLLDLPYREALMVEAAACELDLLTIVAGTSLQHVRSWRPLDAWMQHTERRWSDRRALLARLAGGNPSGTASSVIASLPDPELSSDLQKWVEASGVQSAFDGVVASARSIPTLRSFEAWLDRWQQSPVLCVIARCDETPEACVALEASKRAEPGVADAARRGVLLQVKSAA